MNDGQVKAALIAGSATILAAMIGAVALLVSQQPKSSTAINPAPGNASKPPAIPETQNGPITLGNILINWSELEKYCTISNLKLENRAITCTLNVKAPTIFYSLISLHFYDGDGMEIAIKNGDTAPTVLPDTWFPDSPHRLSFSLYPESVPRQTKTIKVVILADKVGS